MRSEARETPYHGNLLSRIEQKTQGGHKVCKTVETSDIVLSQFGENSQALQSIVIRSMEIRAKELDQPLGLFKSIFASLAKISKTHQFLVFETDLFLITVDFYAENRLVLRIGDRDFVFDTKKSMKRAESVVLTEENGLKWRSAFLQGNFTVGKLLNDLLLWKMKDFSQAFHNGGHFSKEVFLAFQNEFSGEK